MLPRIKSILAIEPFKVTTLWNTGEVREIDFIPLLAEYEAKPQSHFYPLLNPTEFSKVQTDGRTLYWDNLATMRNYSGEAIPAPLDFCPDVLFANSRLIMN